MPKEITITERYNKYITEIHESIDRRSTLSDLNGDVSGSGRPGVYTGGLISSIMGMVGGGVIPGQPPSRPNVDNILAMVNGRPLKVRSGEFITNEPQTKANLPWLKAINAGLNMSDVIRPAGTDGYANAAVHSGAMASQAAQPNQPSIVINTQTNASAQHIAGEIGWQLRTR